MLEIRQLHAGYGAAQVLFGIDLKLRPGDAISLLGRNGMGKSTLVKSIMGVVPASSGEILHGGRNVCGLAPHRIARLGFGWVPEGRQVFPTLSVLDNLTATSADRRGSAKPWTLERIFKLFPRLHERRAQRASTLSGGEQQMLAVGRALMTNPDTLILDEATEGLAPLARREIWNCLASLRQEGLSLIVVDKDTVALDRIVDRHYVLEKGRIVWAGTPTELSRDRTVIERHTAL